MSISNVTKALMTRFPTWMKIRQSEEATGTKFLDAFGLQLEEVQRYLMSVLNDSHLTGVRLSQIDWLYKTDFPFDILDKEKVVVGDGATLRETTTLYDFYQATVTDNAYIIDEDRLVLYSRKKYTAFTINGVSYEQMPHQVWNPLDEFGLLLGLPRLYLETNTIYQQRLLDFFIRPAGPTPAGIKNGLARELGIEVDDIEVRQLHDPVFRSALFDENGVPTDRFKHYVDILNSVVPTMATRQVIGESYWDMVSEDMMGLDFLPHLWDPDETGWQTENYQSGIGDDDDLIARLPDDLPEELAFNYEVKVKGLITTESRVYPAHNVVYGVQAYGNIIDNVPRPQDFWFTVIAAERISLNYTVIAQDSDFEQTKTIDFTSEEVTADPSIDFLTGKSFSYDTMPAAADGTTKIQVKVELQTEDRHVTPQIDSIRIREEHGDDPQNPFIVVLTKDNIDLGSTETTVGAVDTTQGNIRLAKGDYRVKTESQTQFNEGTMTGTEVTAGGVLRLKFS